MKAAETVLILGAAHRVDPGEHRDEIRLCLLPKVAECARNARNRERKRMSGHQRGAPQCLEAVQEALGLSSEKRESDAPPACAVPTVNEYGGPSMKWHF